MKLLPLLIFWCLWFVNFSTRSVLSPILPLIEDSLSISHGQAGGFFSSLSIGFSISLLLSGWCVSLWGNKKTVIIGFVGIGFIFLGIQWVESYSAFHILFFLLGLVTGIYIPAMLPIITETYDSRHWGKAIGFHDSAASFSIFAMPILVAFGQNFFSWRTLLLILGVAALLLPFYFWKVSVEPKKEIIRPRDPFFQLFRKKTVWALGILSTFASGSSFGVYAILPLYLVKERGIDFGYANTLFGVSRIGGVLVSILSGFLTDRFGYRKMILFSLLATGLSTIVLSLASTLPMILITLVLQSIFPLAYFPACFAAISNLTSLSERSMVTGVILSIGVIFGMGSTPLVLGVLADHFSFKTGIFGLGVLVTLSPLALGLLEEKKYT